MLLLIPCEKSGELPIPGPKSRNLTQGSSTVIAVPARVCKRALLYSSFERTTVYVNSSRNHALNFSSSGYNGPGYNSSIETRSVLPASRRIAASIAAACVIGLGASSGLLVAAPSAQALPAGMSVEDARAAISAPISVPAGQTTTVSLPVAANASYSGGGWSVSTSGSTVTITAPPEGGQISVPVTAQGQSATITLVAEGGSGSDGSGASIGAGNGSGGGTGAENGGTSGGNTGGDSTSEDSGEGSPEGGTSGQGNSTGSGSEGGSTGDENTGTGEVSGSENASLPVVPGEKPERQAAEQQDETNAERIDLETTIEGSTITAKLGMRQALDLYQRFGNLDQEQFTLRYIDADGNVIEDVKRDIDAASRTLTLTYPEGQAPDNPFYMQLVRNGGTGVEVIVSLTDPNFQRAGDAANDPVQTAGTNDDDGSNMLIYGAIGIGIVIILIIIAVILRAVSKRRKQDEYGY